VAATAVAAAAAAAVTLQQSCWQVPRCSEHSSMNYGAVLHSAGASLISSCSSRSQWCLAIRWIRLQAGLYKLQCSFLRTHVLGMAYTASDASLQLLYVVETSLVTQAG
jgi:hypothetical protein